MRQLQSKDSDEFDDEFDFAELYYVFDAHKFKILLIALISGIIAVGLSFLSPKQYTSSVILMSTSSNHSGLEGQYSELAGMVGLNLSGQEASPVQKALAIIKSRKFVYNFIEKHELKNRLFYKNWDENKKVWIERFNLKKAILGGSENITYPGKKHLSSGEPTDWEAYDLFNSIMNVQEFEDTGTIEISIQFVNPILARDIANNIVEDINSNLRDESITKSRNTIEFLNSRLQEASLLELKEAISILLKENLQNLALANIEKDYVFSVIDPAVVPEVKSAPKRSVWGVLGFAFGFLVSFIRFYRKKSS